MGFGLGVWSYGIYLFLLVAASSSFGAEKMCRDDDSMPGPVRRVCYFPSCNTGTDCAPPAIDLDDVQITIEDPLFRDSDKCPNQQFSTNCWDAYLKMKVTLSATDPSGIKGIGVYVKQVVEGQELISKFWSHTKDGEAGETVVVGPAQPADPPKVPSPPPPTGVEPKSSTPVSAVKSGRSTITMEKWIFARVPVGQRLEVWVSDLCAIDERDNRGCVPFDRDRGKTPDRIGIGRK